MHKNVIFLASLTFIALLAGIAESKVNDVLIEVSGTQGRGLAFNVDGKCHVITPKHVVTSPLAPRVVGRGRASSNAKVIKEYPVDLAVLAIDDQALCGADPWPTVHLLDDVLEEAAVATLRSRNANGGGSKTRVALRSFNDQSIIVAPTDPATPLAQGQSGSVLVADGKVIGMLLEVRTDDGSGVVFRMDRMEETLQSILHPNVASKDNPLYGCWRKSDGIQLQFDEQGVVTDGIFSGKVERVSNGRDAIIYVPFIDTVELASGGRRLIGTNNYFQPIELERVTGEENRIVGQWRNAISTVTVHPDGTATVPNLLAVWKKTSASGYEFTWNHRFIGILRLAGDALEIRTIVGLYEAGVVQELLTVHTIGAERAARCL